MPSNAFHCNDDRITLLVPCSEDFYGNDDYPSRTQRSQLPSSIFSNVRHAGCPARHLIIKMLFSFIRLLLSILPFLCYHLTTMFSLDPSHQNHQNHQIRQICQIHQNNHIHQIARITRYTRITKYTRITELARFQLKRGRMYYQSIL